jgi:tol-pal system protein YbgF
MLHNRRKLDFAMTSLMTRGLTAAALAAALGAATPASAQDGGGLFDRVFGNNPSSGRPQTMAQSPGQEPTTDQVLRIERLEAQIRQLTGTVEQLQYRNRQLEAQIRGMGGAPGAQSAPGQPIPSSQPMQSDRPMQPGQPLQPLQPLRPPAQVSSGSPVGPPPAAIPGGRRSDVFDPTQNPNAPGAPHTLGSIPGQPPNIVTAEPPVGVPGGRTPGAPLDLSTLAGVQSGVAAEPGQPLPPAGDGMLPPPPSRNPNATGAVASVAPPSDSPKDTYDLAYGYVLRKDYALAEDAFQAFLKKYPTDRRAADAQFWLGESMFQRQRYDAAASAFLDLSTKHTSHTKAPDALLRLAQSLAALKQKEMACATLAEVGRKYPRASNSVKQGVEREQKRVAC